MPSRHTRAAALASIAVLLVVGGLAAWHVAARHESLEARERGGEAGETPEGPADWFYAQRANPDGSLPEASFAAAVAQARVERSPMRATGYATRALAWQNAGPYNVGGRVTALAVDPANTSTIYLGSANGGVWKSVNAGVNWTCVTDGYPFYSVGSLALDPSTPGTIYCGTGEANGSVDSYDGNGLWRSSDYGASWTNLGLTTTGRIARVVVDPADPAHVLVAAMGRQFSTSPDRGVYQTHDGGTTWSRVLYVSDSTGVTDLVINPAHPDTMFCATWERVRRLTYRRTSGPESGVWRSIDRGTTWARLSVGLPTPTDSVGRIALAVAPSRPSTVYAQVTGGASLGYAGVGFYRSLDGGDTWTRMTTGGTWSSNFGGFAWYFGDINADPNNPDHVWTQGVNLLSSGNGGVTWGSVNGTLHADQHALWIDPANSLHEYMGNDGGFWWSSTGASWTHSSDLPISQYYDGDVHPTTTTTIYGGLQDNGTVMTTSGPGSWTAILSGDGFHVLVDPVTPNVVFSEYQNCCGGFGFVRSTTGGPSPSGTSGWNTSDRFGWDTPICMNPRNHNVLLAGSQYVYRSTDNGLTWFKINGQDMSTNPVSQLVFGCLTTLAISAADTNVYYAGTDDANVWRSNNRGASWTSIKAGLPGRWVTRLVPDPTDAQVVYVTESGFTQDAQASLVFRSTNQGGAWTNISGNLPNMPANDLVVDPADGQTLFLATDVGVWVTRNLGAGWYALGDGMPLQAVFDLTLQAANRQLYAFTHGRSVWRLDLAGLPPASVAAAAPPRLELSPPWPNPASGAVRMSLEISRDAAAEVVIYDIVGRRVSTLYEGPVAAGRREIAWDRRDARGRRADAGVYFVRALVGGSARTQRLVLVH